MTDIYSLINYLFRHLLYAGTILGSKDSVVNEDRQDWSLLSKGSHSSG